MTLEERLLLKDNCTKSEAQRFIHNGSYAVPTSEWHDHIMETWDVELEGEPPTVNDIKQGKEPDWHFVVDDDGKEYILVYVL